MSKPRLRLVQLPIPQPACFAPTGNVPLAAASLAVAARRALPGRLDVELIAPERTERLGDAALIDALAAAEPDLLGLSLYLWNAERSLHVAREVKRRSPRTRVVVGGPEVSPDNPFLLEAGGFDVAVTGEAEESFPRLLEACLQGGDPTGVPGAGVRRDGALHFTPAVPASFGLAELPSPYLDGVLPVDGRRSTYVETVRGCRSHCTFCFYPRSSASLRALDVAGSTALLAALRDRGAREVVFLDPTFNHRPGFDELLDALVAENRSRALGFFAEVRAEGLTEEHADRLAAAGFTRLEIGLQSVNRATLARIRRGGSPELVARAARMLSARGIDLLIDLIIGLPGDTADDVRHGIAFLKDHGLADYAQVFPLFVLPGTAMRASAASDGLHFDAFPPYRIRRTATLDEAAIRDLMLEAEDALERHLDEQPRPHLVQPDPGQDPPAVMHVDVDGDAAAAGRAASRPGAPHVALWLHGRDLWARRDTVDRVIAARMAVDPHCILDVVLAPTLAPPLDLIARVRRACAAGPSSYARWALAHRGIDAQHRVAVVVQRGLEWSQDYLLHLMELAPVFREMDAPEAVRQPERLGDDLPGALVTGAVDAGDWRQLLDRADPAAVAFARPDLERRWVETALTYREIA